ncbi:30S ribosomal protein S6 [Roseibacillus ishigakijimensis]|uniref:30S ribosomal protein S6 n=1 Tax=Roseibacillus ishigakijimensis TaxID=454146 RepID=UPI0027DCE526|nr:30S ribosomal protein S6 [Roseibacillus ishigakijimensis]
MLNTKGSDKGIDDLVSSVGKEMEAVGAKLDEIQQLGRRKFAYNARDLDGGHYVNFIFLAEPEVIGKIQERLRLNDLVYLQHYQRLS